MNKDIFKKLRDIFIPHKGNNYRPKFLDSNFLIYYLAILLVIKFAILPIFVCFQESSFFAALTKDYLITLTNQERAALGVAGLKDNELLAQAATLKAQDMLNMDYFSHNSPEGKTPWYWIRLAGYNYKRAGENLAIGFVDGEEVMQAWKDSPTHNANLINPNYQEIGIGIAKGNFQGQEVTLVVQMFGTQLNPTPVKKVEVAVKKTATSSVSSTVKQPDPTKSNASSTKPVAETVKSEVQGQSTSSRPTTTETEQVKTVSSSVEMAIIQSLNSQGQDIQLQASSTPASLSLTSDNPSSVQGAESQVMTTPLSSGTSMPAWRAALMKFLTVDYSRVIEKLNFLSLITVMIGLLLTIFIEIKIQPKDLLLKGSFFVLVFGVLLFADKIMILRFIPHNLVIG